MKAVKHSLEILRKEREKLENKSVKNQKKIADIERAITLLMANSKHIKEKKEEALDYYSSDYM